MIIINKGKSVQINLFLILFFSFLSFYCDKEVSVSSPDLPVPVGKIYFETIPPGAEIFLNGDNTGKLTPDSILYLEPGEYYTRFRFDPYMDLFDTLTLREDQPGNFSANFLEDTRNYGSIACSSEPTNALIWLGDSCTNLYTPNTLQPIWPGLYTVRFTYPEHRASKTSIRIRGGENKSTHLTLKDTTLTVDYNPITAGLPGYIASCIAIDRKGIKWVGMNGYGLLKFDEQTWTSYLPSNSALPKDIITCIAIDDQNKKWIGTFKGLVTIDDGGNWEVFTKSNSDIPNDYINAICFDSESNVWIGASSPISDHFLIKFDGENWDQYQTNGLVFAVAVDHAGLIWVGCHNGINIFDGVNWRQDISENMPTGTLPIDDIDVDKAGRIWIGVGGDLAPLGLYMYDGVEFSMFELPLNYASAIHCADNGNIWIATQGKYLTLPPVSLISLIRIDPLLNVTPYTSNEIDLVGDYWFTGVATQSNGDVWLSSRRNGVSKFKRANL